MPTKLLKIALICALLTGCATAPDVKTQVIKIKPDVTWMADPGMPAKAGETLGDYHEWGHQLFIDKCENIIQRWAMRNFYSESDSPIPESFDSCPGNPKHYGIK